MQESADSLRSFIAASLKVLRDHASKSLEPDGEEAQIRLAAHLFAVGSVLSGRFSQGRFLEGADSLEFDGSLREALLRVVELPERITGHALFEVVVDTLSALEEHWQKKPGENWFPPHTDLLGLEAHAMGGQVLHWLRPPNASLQKRKERRELDEGKGSPNPSALPDEFLDRLCFYWNSDPQLPLVTGPPSIHRPHALVFESGADARGASGFRIALCPLIGPFSPRFELTADSHRFQGLHVFDQDPDPECGCNDHLRALVRQANAQNIQVLLFPELMVDLNGRASTFRALASLGTDAPPEPYGIVAGSFHIPGEEGTLPANESVLVDRQGRTLLRHHKRGRFRLTGLQATQASKLFTNFPLKFPREIKEVVEEIDARLPVQVLETSLGRMMIAICADCIAPDATNLSEIIHRLRPDLLFLVSMSPKTEPFEGVFKDLAGRGISVFFVNAHSILSGSQTAPPLLAAAHLALFEPAGAPPTRIQWRLGDHRPEVRYFAPRDPKLRDWHVPKEPAATTGVDLLELQGGPVGLVIDLGPHFRWAKGLDTAEQNR